MSSRSSGQYYGSYGSSSGGSSRRSGNDIYIGNGQRYKIRYVVTKWYCVRVEPYSQSLLQLLTLSKCECGYGPMNPELEDSCPLRECGWRRCSSCPVVEKKIKTRIT